MPPMSTNLPVPNPTSPSVDEPSAGDHTEAERIRANAAGERDWYAWGPYLSERQWGTVREDYSPHGEAWDYFPHDLARSRAYRWGEDGLAGFCDAQQRVCLGLALWNGHDPILKERLFGLTNAEGNHGEDVKEAYYYLDATPSHSYLRMLYKYPQRPFPYTDLVEVNRARGQHEPEYELHDTDAFADDRYFDVEIEYAKAATDDICMRVTAHNRGPEPARLHLIPQLWFRNTWSWGDEPTQGRERPRLLRSGAHRVDVHHPEVGDFVLHAERGQWLFTENESNPARVWCDPTARGYFKDAFHAHIVDGRTDATNPAEHGTKVGLHHVLDVDAGASVVIRLRLRPSTAERRTAQGAAFEDFDAVFQHRRDEADAYYAHVQRDVADPDRRAVQRQAFAGLIWSKQFFYYDVQRWLTGDPGQPPPPPGRRQGRNAQWAHLNNADVISMPDKWEYPWYAAWDLAFHCIPLALVDVHFAKQQLDLLTREWYMHPNGQLPAYEWALSDVNPPVHAWATWRVYQIEREQTGKADLAFLETIFHKLMLNFTWWVNRKDREGRNVFQGGFLGLDNIGVFDRSAPLPTGGYLTQSDGTSWMAMYSLNLMRIALELACENPVYENIATKFFEHFLHIAQAMTNMAGAGIGLWDEQDEFYYDVLNLEQGDRCTRIPVRLRSLVGLIPLFAVEVLEPELLERLPGFAARLQWVLDNKPELAALVSRWEVPGQGERRLLSLLRGHRVKKLLERMLDPAEFLSDYGVRGISQIHRDEPYTLQWGDQHFSVHYDPAESTTGLFGGNSNWRGPIWMPVNYLLVESLQRFHSYYGDDFQVEYPVGSGAHASLAEVADGLATRLCRIFLADEQGHRPVFGHAPRMQSDPAFRDHLLFYEYFDGDTGRGVGASHQTGWTALVADLLRYDSHP